MDETRLTGRIGRVRPFVAGGGRAWRTLPARGGRVLHPPRTAAVVSASVLFVPLGIARLPFLVVALAAGALFLAYGLKGIFGNAGERWARNER